MDYGSSGGDSECSSGCESGWTLYFENSYIPSHHSCDDDNSHSQGHEFVARKSGFCQENEEEEEEEEDLSMVSDASSGPPHFVEEDNYGQYSHNHGCSYYHHATPLQPSPALPNKTHVKSLRSNENMRRKNIIEKQAAALDDTASSPIFNFSNNNFAMDCQATVDNGVLDFSQGYSTNYPNNVLLQGGSVYQEQCGFYLPSLVPGNQLSICFVIYYCRILDLSIM
ncbi:unnamed protein product [Cuscuta epithymum]|uniref:Uncharacterized protein n=1 Tax=Cuscuta epithymum TaxID=186058 RepID=A0AAV0E408_9ASTE|nr:unnamed protein product [Cuscuta epithymum]